MQVKDTIAFASDTSLTTAEKIDKDKAQDWYSEVKPDTEGSRNEYLHHFQAIAIPGNN